MRPLLWHHPNDPAAVACTDEFLVGENLLVAPILRAGATARAVYLPRGEWFDFHSGALLHGGTHSLVHAPLERIPLFVRAGTLLPLAPLRPCIGSTEPDTLSLHLWPGTDGHLEWYDDDGLTLAHQSGAWSRRTLTSASGPRGGVLRIGPRLGTYQGPLRTLRIVLREVRRGYQVRTDRHKIKARHVPEAGVLTFDIPVTDEPREIRWR
jgi:alpha-glucosidase